MVKIAIASFNICYLSKHILYKALLCRVAYYNNMVNILSFCSSILRATHYTELLQRCNDKLILTYLSPCHLIVGFVGCLTKLPEVIGRLHNFFNYMSKYNIFFFYFNIMGCKLNAQIQLVKSFKEIKKYVFEYFISAR